MTDAVPTDATDRRRAAALISHRATVDEVGARYIITDARTANRLPNLVAAVTDHGGQLLAALRTDMGLEAVSSMFDTWAQQNENVDYRRAASVILGRYQGKHDIFNGHIADAVADGRTTELVNTAAQLFLTVMPELHSPKGRTSLAQLAVAFSAEEE